jgi:hypothetical protein
VFLKKQKAGGSRHLTCFGTTSNSLAWPNKCDIFLAGIGIISTGPLPANLLCLAIQLGWGYCGVFSERTSTVSRSRLVVTD